MRNCTPLVARSPTSSFVSADQDSVRLLAVEGCAAIGKLLEKSDCEATVLPIILSFAGVGTRSTFRYVSARRASFDGYWPCIHAGQVVARAIHGGQSASRVVRGSRARGCKVNSKFTFFYPQLFYPQSANSCALCTTMLVGTVSTCMDFCLSGCNLSQLTSSC